ncbi:hypothetical protein PENTCL1PPCAC_5575, partial [Pristionchus entomophagus]
TSARLVGSTFSLLMALTRLTAIWTKKIIGLAIACVWMITAMVTLISAIIRKKVNDMMLDSQHKSFFRCVSRMTIVAFVITI